MTTRSQGCKMTDKIAGLENNGRDRRRLENDDKITGLQNDDEIAGLENDGRDRRAGK